MREISRRSVTQRFYLIPGARLTDHSLLNNFAGLETI